MTKEKRRNKQQNLVPTILAGCVGFMIICAWAFIPNPFRPPTIDFKLTENEKTKTDCVKKIINEILK